MVQFPQHGGCVCGDVRFTLSEDPVAVYACHCTDCQTETGSAFFLSAVVRSDALEFTKAAPLPWQVTLPDGRIKGALHCTRCKCNVGGPSRLPNLSALDVGTFDDTSWLEPAAHIWTRSAQPWLRLPESSLRYPEAPGDAAFVDIARAWKERATR